MLPAKCKDEALVASITPTFFDYLKTRIQIIEDRLAQHPFVFGDTFTVADPYFFTVFNWAPYAKLDLSEFTHCCEYVKRIEQRESIAFLREKKLLGS